VLTRRKVSDQLRHDRTQRRGGGHVIGEAVLDDGGAGLDRLPGPEPTPEFAAVVAEEYRLRVEAPGGETVRRVANWKLEGYTADEVAARLGCTRRSVQRKLALIRQEWCGENL